MRLLRSPLVALVALGAIALSAACGGTDAPPGTDPSGSSSSAGGGPGGSGPGTGSGGGDPSEPGEPVKTTLPPEQQAELAEIEKKIDACEALTADSFQAEYAVPWAKGLPYDPTQAEHLPLIQSSALGLDADELAALGARGFVLSEKKRFPTFTYGYAAIYSQDLPLYISADSILYAVHRSYDAILAAIETHSLVPDLEQLLGSMRARLASGGAASLGEEARKDADLFLAVATSLLTGENAKAVAGASDTEIQKLVDSATAAEGAATVILFGAVRDVDFSQFEPRGHYTDTEQLERYFRAMMWLGRIDLRLLETQPDHSQVFHRRQLEGALALRELMEPVSVDRWKRIHDTIGAFVGEPDSMTVPELGELLADLGAKGPADLAGIPDQTIAQAIIDGGYGTQRISSHIMVNGLGSGTMPLSSSFAFFGQRYVLDSHVFSNVVYDRVQHGEQMRMMPDPLDAAFAALSNDQAGALLDPQLEKYSYAPDLCAMRVLADAHDETFWSGSLYNLWLSSLRALSPTDEIADPAGAGLPSIVATEAWGRRILSTQLASWAELRHDTILYAKQSYTGGATCEFPDAYVDPYPGFYAAIGAFADKGKGLVAALDLSAAPWLKEAIGGWFDQVGSVAAMLGDMAARQRAGEPFTPAQMQFVNETVAIQEGCGAPEGSTGWYAKLFFDPILSVTLDPTIADVHTQPTDEVGTPVGRILHVGTGMARLFVVTADGCSGPRAYVGVASSYFERVTQNWQRLDDEAWKAEIEKATPPDPPWLSGIVVR